MAEVWLCGIFIFLRFVLRPLSLRFRVFSCFCRCALRPAFLRLRCVFCRCVRFLRCVELRFVFCGF